MEGSFEGVLNIKSSFNVVTTDDIKQIAIRRDKGVGTGGARGAMAPTLLKTVDFGPPTFQCTISIAS